MKILVTGGAGYIGSVCVKRLIDAGHDVVIVDNLSKGLKRLIHKDAKFYHLDLVGDLSPVFEENEIDAVIHIAAYKVVVESMENAPKYSDNITGTINLLNMMVKYNVKKIVFSSSAAVYGDPEYNPVDESHPTRPANYYGKTKLMAEELFDWYARIHNIQYVALRYFNVVGDELNHFDPDPKNVLPIIVGTAFGKTEVFNLYGNDYDTKDGTCVRDYIDVKDLVDAHLLALELNTNEIINLGTSNGVSVKELVDITEKLTGNPIKVNYAERRKGDSAVVLASNDKASKLLKWEPKVPIEESVRKTCEAYKSLME